MLGQFVGVRLRAGLAQSAGESPVSTVGERRQRRGKLRYPTSTLSSDGRLVPWLAAEGPLAYTPEAPPARDSLFQYGWVLPQVCRAGLRGRLYFGCHSKDGAGELFDFWENARRGRADRVVVREGRLADGGLDAPIAVYRHRTRLGEDHYLFIQHGSYQFVPVEEQPHLEAGDVLLHRGIGAAEVFCMAPRRQAGGDRHAAAAWESYVALQFEILSRSDGSFNSIHDRAKRSETCHIHDRSWITDALARERGLDIEHDPWAQTLWKAVHQSFALRSWVSQHKFGPHRVVCRTPLANIRITSFFAGEHEARMLDPDRVEVVAAIGCRVAR